jgi:phosphohistidine phosphatase
MKTLYLLRHAKSSWDDASLSDFDRPLNERGRRTAPRMGQLMRERNIIPQVIISSPAVRASETATAVAAAAGYADHTVFEPRVYEASPNDLRKIIADLNDNFSSAMIVGQIPGREWIIYYRTGRVEPMPTAALAVIEMDVEAWSDVSDGGGRLVTVLRPREQLSAGA